MTKLINLFQHKVPKKILFIEAMLDDIDSDYFIAKIEQGILEKNNNSYKTQLQGKMTYWEFFNEDPIFRKMLKKALECNPVNYNNYRLIESWGFKINRNEHTNLHQHSCSFSGIFYLNDCKTELIFPELNIGIIPRKNKFVFFSGFLEHGTKKLDDDVKYGISFNILDVQAKK